MYRQVTRLLFRLEPERAHQLTLTLLRAAGTLAPVRKLLRAQFALDDPRLAVNVLGVNFANPVGLAAGYDKDGVAVPGLSCLGFGHVEVGTITREPQPGHPRPRLHRVAEANALINRMGFPNVGAANLKIERGAARIGINIGKGQDTPLERAAEDYIELLRAVHRQADYVALNISSPNTQNLRRLQARTALQELLCAVVGVRNNLAPRVPLLVKLAPDLQWVEIDDLVRAVLDCGIDGIIATNTTIAREGVAGGARALAGGLSGAPLRARSTAIIRHIARVTGGRLPIVGVGGIMSAADALEKLRAGASLIQVYTGLVYRGPALVRQINAALLDACAREGARSVTQLIPQLGALPLRA